MWKWVDIGLRPVRGRELTNCKLAQELRRKTEFSPQEWKEFGVSGLRADDLGASYFRPARSAVSQDYVQLHHTTDQGNHRCVTRGGTMTCPSTCKRATSFARARAHTHTHSLSLSANVQPVSHSHELN